MSSPTESLCFGGEHTIDVDYLWSIVQTKLKPHCKDWTQEEMFQELALAACVCVEIFNSDAGMSFANYMYTWGFRKVLDRYYRYRYGMSRSAHTKKVNTPIVYSPFTPEMRVGLKAPEVEHVEDDPHLTYALHQLNMRYPHESDVLQLRMAGMTMKACAEALSIGVRTAEKRYAAAIRLCGDLYIEHMEVARDNPVPCGSGT